MTTTQHHPWGDDHGIPARRCNHCKQLYFPKFDGAALCFPCYRKNRDAKQARSGDRDAAQRTATTLLLAQTQIAAQQQEIDRLRRDKAALEDVVAEYRAQAERIRRELADNLPRLRQLCHPDRHDGSQAATLASQWLNGIRRRVEDGSAPLG